MKLGLALVGGLLAVGGVLLACSSDEDAEATTQDAGSDAAQPGDENLGQKCDCAGDVESCAATICGSTLSCRPITYADASAQSTGVCVRECGSRGQTTPKPACPAANGPFPVECSAITRNGVATPVDYCNLVPVTR